MSKVFCAHAVSVDGYISGRTPDGGEEFGRGLGDAGMLFDWYMDGDTPSQLFGGFKLSEPSARLFDTIAARVGATVAGRTTYEHSGHWGGSGPHPTARLFVLSHRPAPVPVLLGAGRPFFHELPEHVRLRLLEAIPAPGVTHLHYEVVR
jgi:dihydrofolate reductase